MLHGLASLLLLAVTPPAPGPDPADLVLLGGKIVTLDPARGEVPALAARGGRIVALGADDEIRRFVGPATRVVELGSALAIPGFIEAHGHFGGMGNARTKLDLRSAATWDEVLARVERTASVAAPGEWIVGWGWHQEKWSEPPSPAVLGYPTHERLGRIAPHNPVMLRHAAGNHAGIANAAALALAGITRETSDPTGGRIVRDAAGAPTGVLLENAWAQVVAAHDRAQAARSPAEIEARSRKELLLADELCARSGITSFQDAGSDLSTIDRLRAMVEAGELDVRLWVMIADSVDTETLARRAAEYRILGAGDGHLTVRAIKRYMDGALGSHGAWLLAPYADRRDSSGMNVTSLGDLERAAELAITHSFQLCTHAIGDRANRETLDLYERAFARHPELRDLRWRIEHAQHVDPADVPRFARLGVIASMQGVHCTSDGPWVEERLGPERAAAGAYVWRRLLDSGAIVANGTDAPIEDVDPVANFHASVTRRMANGQAFHPAQRMTRLEALRSQTLDAARAAFEEQDKGSLAVGKLADVTVLSADILTVPEERIREARVLYTIVGGRIVYEAVR